MSYTAPSGNSVNFSQTGNAYSAPAGNAVNFSWVPDVPTVYINCRSTISFYGRGLAESVFSLAGSSSVVAEQPYRAFSITSGSVLTASTWLRDLQISTGSVLNIRSGTAFSIPAGTSFGLVALSLAPAKSNIDSSSDFHATSASLFRSATSISTKTKTSLKGGYNAMTRAVISGRSIVRADYSTLSKSVFLSGASSSPVFVSNLARLTSYAIGSSSFVSPKASVVKPAEAHPYGGSSISFSGIGAKQSAFSLSGHAALQFYSNYTTTPLPDTEFEDVVFVKTAPISVFVRQ